MGLAGVFRWVSLLIQGFYIFDHDNGISPARQRITGVDILGLFAIKQGNRRCLQSPFGVLGTQSALAEPQQLLLEDVSRTRVEKLDRAVLAYQLSRGQIPESLQQLVEAGLVDPGFLEDPWGQPYDYARTDSGYAISASAADTPAKIAVERALSLSSSPPARPQTP